MFRKITLLWVLFLVHFGAFAQWIQQGSNSEVTVYINPEGIIKSNGMIRVWYLFDYKTPKISPIKFPYSSSRELLEFDCQLQTLRNLTFTWFEGSMGQGDVLRNYTKPSELQNVAPDTFESWLLKNACSKQKQ